MMNRDKAIAYGKRIEVHYYIYDSHNCLMGGSKTMEQAKQLKEKLEKVWSEKMYIVEVNPEPPEEDDDE